MSLATNLTDLSTRIATEAKALRTLINGNATDLSALTTTAKSNLVVALNEVAALSGGSIALNDLTDVVITAGATGDIIRHNGTNFVDAVGTAFFDSAGNAAAAQAAAIAASQPLDSDLTAIAALTTTAYGRAILTLADAAALTALLNAATELVAGKVELATTVEAAAGVDTTRAVTPAGVQAAIDALVGAAPALLNTLTELSDAIGDDPNFAATMTTALGTKQPLDADLTSIAGLTSAANKGVYATGASTWSLYDLSGYGRTIANFADAAAARTSIDVYSKTEIGDPATDFVATFNAGLV